MFYFKPASQSSCPHSRRARADDYGLRLLQVTDPKDGHSYATFGHGVVHGMIISLLVILPVFVTMTIFEKRSWSWAFVNWGY